MWFIVSIKLLFWACELIMLASLLSQFMKFFLMLSIILMLKLGLMMNNFVMINVFMFSMCIYLMVFVVSLIMSIEVFLVLIMIFIEINFESTQVILKPFKLWLWVVALSLLVIEQFYQLKVLLFELLYFSFSYKVVDIVHSILSWSVHHASWLMHSRRLWVHVGICANVYDVLLLFAHFVSLV